MPSWGGCKDKLDAGAIFAAMDGRRIFLIGFMGAGKSQCGRQLAELLGFPFIDLDEVIEQREGSSISDIFARRGEGYFRQLERTVLESLLPLPSFVMATGGGTPCFDDTIVRLNAAGTTVFLDVPVADLVERLRHASAHRPLLAEREDLHGSIEQRLTERRSCYECAHLHLQLDNQTTDAARLIYHRLLHHHDR